MRHSRCRLPVAWWMRATVAAVRSGLRPTSTTVAPCCAKACAVTRPIPEVAPVTRQTLPCIEGVDAAIGLSPLVKPENHHPHRSGAHGIDLQGLQPARVLVNPVRGEVPRFQPCSIEK